MRSHFTRTKTWLSGHRDWLLTLLLVVATALAINYAHIGSYGRYFTAEYIDSGYPDVAVVLGGGIENGKPRPLLRDRLIAAAELYKDGEIKKILVSGDNRFDAYNEPKVMSDYLVKEQGIPADAIVADNAGRSTYETCERAKKIFGLEKAVLISESTHLPRAIYLCRHFGIEAVGKASDGESSSGLRAGQRWREFLARTKASLNVYIIGEQTILGDKIKL